MQLRQLKPGVRFRVVGLDRTGELVKVNDCRAHVIYDVQPQRVEFDSRTGEHRAFIACRGNQTGIAPSTEVEVL